MRQARQAGLVSQLELSQATGIPQASLSRYESGLVTPSAHKAVLIEVALGFDPGSMTAKAAAAASGRAAPDPRQLRLVPK